MFYNITFLNNNSPQKKVPVIDWILEPLTQQITSTEEKSQHKVTAF